MSYRDLPSVLVPVRSVRRGLSHGPTLAWLASCLSQVFQVGRSGVAIAARPRPRPRSRQRRYRAAPVARFPGGGGARRPVRRPGRAWPGACHDQQTHGGPGNAARHAALRAWSREVPPDRAGRTGLSRDAEGIRIDRAFAPASRRCTTGTDGGAHPGIDRRRGDRRRLSGDASSRRTPPAGPVGAPSVADRLARRDRGGIAERADDTAPHLCPSAVAGTRISPAVRRGVGPVLRAGLSVFRPCGCRHHPGRSGAAGLCGSGLRGEYDQAGSDQAFDAVRRGQAGSTARQQALANRNSAAGWVYGTHAPHSVRRNPLKPRRHR
jgi:hypothetical protein